MDNTQRIAGYKQYVEPGGDIAPAVFVAFLNVEPADGEEVIGALAKVTQQEFDRLKRRERNYAAVDVGAWLEPTPADGKAFAFLGLREARARYVAATEAQPVFISRSYAALVECAVRVRGRVVWENYAAAQPDPARLKDLEVRDL